MPTVLSVNVGMPKSVPWKGRTVYTGVWKHSVAGPRRVRRLNIDGDGQGDTEGHGGEIRAVLVYQIQSYEHWQKHFGRDDFTYGQFGENLTIDGLADDEVCIGDRYRIGTAEFEVTQPRVTCYRVGLRFGEPDMASLLVAHHRPGFYFRVITEGDVRAGDEIVKTSSGPGGLSVADADALLYLPGRDIGKLNLAVGIPALSPGWRQSFRDLLDAAQGGAASARPPVGVEPEWNGFRRLRVTNVVPETATVSAIYLAAEDGGPLPAARPGQYLSIRIADAGSPAPVRSYSLSSAPGADVYRLTVKCEPLGQVSGYLHSKLRPGAMIDATSPRGTFVLHDGCNSVLLISAGIGVTPVLAMLHQLAAEHTERDVWWIHASRRPAEHALAGEAHALVRALPHAHEHVFYSADGVDQLLQWHAVAGRLSADKIAQLAIPADTDAYICGPATFMADMHEALVMEGIGAGHIHTELFGALPSINPGLTDHPSVPPHQPHGPCRTGPLITFTRSGLSVPFDNSRTSVLDLADACDVPTRWSCRTGVCHTCVTPLITGEVTYSPTPLELPASGQVLICCARPNTDLVLDM